MSICEPWELVNVQIPLFLFPNFSINYLCWLVVSTLLKNMSLSVGMMTFPISWKNHPFMFQTFPNHQADHYSPLFILNFDSHHYHPLMIINDAYKIHYFYGVPFVGWLHRLVSESLERCLDPSHIGSVHEEGQIGRWVEPWVSGSPRMTYYIYIYMTVYIYIYTYIYHGCRL